LIILAKVSLGLKFIFIGSNVSIFTKQIKKIIF
jgi:hypothetical protein